MQNHQPLRLWLIELLSWWEGAVSTAHLRQHFAISRTQAQLDLQFYRQQQPTNLYYCPSHKVFIPNENFTFGYISNDVAEYLHWLHRSDSSFNAVRPQIPVTALELPARQVSAKVMRVLVAALRQQRKVDVDYVSLSQPDWLGRNIVPHHFVNTGLRWHLRAYCEKSKEYRDFVLSRFRGEPELLDWSAQGAAQDVGWNTQVEIQLQPDPRLSPAQQQVIAADYCMRQGVLHLKTRACLAQYLLQELQVNTRPIAISPEAQQLVLINAEQLKPWLFQDKSDG